MVQRSEVKKWQHGTVVVGARPLLHAQVRVNVTVQVPALKAPGIGVFNISTFILF